VDRRVRYVRSTTHGPYPDSTLILQQKPYSADFALAQFVVDTAGRAIVKTLGMLASPTALPIKVVSESMIGWRFEPAMRRGCKVAQLVHMPLRWK
jgi:hypothetical protein